MNIAISLHISRLHPLDPHHTFAPHHHLLFSCRHLSTCPCTRLLLVPILVSLHPCYPSSLHLASSLVLILLSHPTIRLPPLSSSFHRSLACSSRLCIPSHAHPRLSIPAYHICPTAAATQVLSTTDVRIHLLPPFLQANLLPSATKDPELNFIQLFPPPTLSYTSFKFPVSRRHGWLPLQPRQPGGRRPRNRPLTRDRSFPQRRELTRGDGRRRAGSSQDIASQGSRFGVRETTTVPPPPPHEHERRRLSLFSPSRERE